MSNRVLHLDLLHDGSILESDLNGISDGSLVGVQAVIKSTRKSQLERTTRRRERGDELVDRELLLLLAVHLLSKSVDSRVRGDVVGAEERDTRLVRGEKDGKREGRRRTSLRWSVDRR